MEYTPIDAGVKVKVYPDIDTKVEVVRSNTELSAKSTTWSYLAPHKS